MSNVQRFVSKGANGRSTTPPLPAQTSVPVPSARRVLAQNLKAGVKKISAVAPLPDTAPNLGYAVNAEFGQTAIPVQQYAAQPAQQGYEQYGQYEEEPAHAGRNAFDDSTITSDFDDTITDAGGSRGMYQDAPDIGLIPAGFYEPPGAHTMVEEHEQYESLPAARGAGDLYDAVNDANEDNEQDGNVYGTTTNSPNRQRRRLHFGKAPIPLDTLQPKRTIAPIIPQQDGFQSPSRKAGISGRFVLNSRHNSSGLSLRPGETNGQRHGNPGRDMLREIGIEQRIIANGQQQFVDEQDDPDESEEEDDGDEDGSPAPASQSESMGPDGAPSETERHQGRRSQTVQLEEMDYLQRLKTTVPVIDDPRLKSMNFADLIGESFETAPVITAPPAVEQEPFPAHTNLDDKIKHHLELDQSRALKNEAHQHDTLRDFFGNMPADEWEEAGDWFLTRFGDILQQLKAARQDKRRQVAALEKELATRENLVRRKNERLTLDLAEMRRGGRSVIAGKTV